MTNGDWIRGMTDAEIYRDVMGACRHHVCGKCPWYDARGLGKCMYNNNYDKETCMEWLESEHKHD